MGSLEATADVGQSSVSGAGSRRERAAKGWRRAWSGWLYLFERISTRDELIMEGVFASCSERREGRSYVGGMEAASAIVTLGERWLKAARTSKVAKLSGIVSTRTLKNWAAGIVVARSNISKESARPTRMSTTASKRCWEDKNPGAMRDSHRKRA